MNPNIKLATAAAVLTLAGCGGGSSGNSSGGSGTVSIGLSDAPVDDVKEVTVEVDSITLKMTGAKDIVIDRFTSDQLGIVDADTFQINLLDYQGSAQAIVIDQLQLPAGKYSDLRLKILDEDINKSYVTELDDTRKELKVPSEELKLGGFTIDAGSVQTFTIDFNLRHALVYRTVGTGGSYILKPQSVDLVENASAAELSGTIDSSLFNSVTPCDAKAEPTAGNVVYLYSGHSLNESSLADVYDAELSATTIPDGAIAPYSSKSPVQQDAGGWKYDFGYLPAGDYTLVFSCDAASDSPEDYDGITLPLPTDQKVELTLEEGTASTCNLPIVDGACGS